MRTFKNDPAGFKSIRVKILARTIPLLSIALLVGFGLGYFNAGGGRVTSLLIVVPFGIGLMAVSIFKGINRQKQLFESYILTIDDAFICRYQSNVVEIKIAWDQIREIVKNQDGGFVIQGQQKSDLIYVGNQIEGYKDLEAILASHKEINHRKGKPYQQSLTLAMVVVSLALMVTVYVSTNRYLVLVCGVLLSAGLTWSFYTIQSNKNIDKKTKRAGWWVLVVLIAIISITYSKFVG